MLQMLNSSRKSDKASLPGSEIINQNLQPGTLCSQVYSHVALKRSKHTPSYGLLTQPTVVPDARQGPQHIHACLFVESVEMIIRWQRHW